MEFCKKYKGSKLKKNYKKVLPSPVFVYSKYAKFSSNIVEVIRKVFNFYFFFYDKISQAQKSTNLLTANKHKKLRIKTFRRKKVTFSLICALCFYIVVLLCF